MRSASYDVAADGVPTGPGLWALEASAGTGKTWNIENFAARYLASGAVLPEELVIVTFTKAAARELQVRIRASLTAALALEPAGGRDTAQRAALRHALANYGQLRISTIHAFAQRSLALLGEPIDQVTDETGSATYLASVFNEAVRCLSPASLADLVAIDGYRNRALRALTRLAHNPTAQLLDSGRPGVEGPLAEVIARARDITEARKAELGWHDYNDMLTRLASRLRTPRDAALLASTIKVLLIDEFQDTDALQLEIFTTLAHAGHLLAYVGVGDPKQAIYGFRGGDVQVYREAVPEGSAHVLTTNFRSTSRFVEAANLFFAGTDFGIDLDDEPVAVTEDLSVATTPISYRPVRAGGPRADLGDALGPPWRYREVEAPQTPQVRARAFADLVRVVRAKVGREQIPDPDTGQVRAVDYRDICVLVTANEHAADVARALQREGVPVSLLGGDNVFASEAAAQWASLLRAVSRPARASSARLLAQSWFGGCPLSEIHAHLGDDRWLGPWQASLVAWSEIFATRPRHDFFDAVVDESDVLVRLTRYEGAERNVTDLVHLSEILRSRPLDSLAELIDLLETTDAREEGDVPDTEVAGGAFVRRIEDDRSAVRVMTVHKAKGLQFPIVLVPYLSDYSRRDSVVSYRAYDPAGTGVSVVDLGAASDAGRRVGRALDVSEGLRRAYVALTRAMYQNIVWVWPTTRGGDPIVRSRDGWRALAEEHPDLFARDEDEPPAPVVVPRALAREVATLGGRTLPAPLRRLSYSSLVDLLDAPSTLEVEADRETDDDEGTSGSLAPLEEGRFADLVGSVTLGKVVHRVFELVDVSSPDVDASLDSLVREAGEEFGLGLDDPSARRVVRSADVVDLVGGALATPLGDIAPGRRLLDLGPGARLTEVGFDLAIDPDVTASDVFAVVRRHLATVPGFAGWLERLHVRDEVLGGVLTGSLDAIFADGPPDDPRFFVVDYKTNRLGEGSPDEYTPRATEQAMAAHHYPLQALIYLVALHRYLRSRLPDYAYQRHVRGAAYLFVRGMRPERPGQGVVWLAPPAAAIEELSDLLDGVRS